MVISELSGALQDWQQDKAPGTNVIPRNATQAYCTQLLYLTWNLLQGPSSCYTPEARTPFLGRAHHHSSQSTRIRGLGQSKNSSKRSHKEKRHSRKPPFPAQGGQGPNGLTAHG